MRWEIIRCGEDDAELLDILLKGLWEPFAVSAGFIWFRKQAPT